VKGRAELKLAAHGVCLRDDRILLARYVSPDRSQQHWTLPGGKVEHAEDPYDTVIRETAEETGYRVAVERLLGVDSRTRTVDWIPGGGELHTVGVYYRLQITSGELRSEIGGSTDLAAWLPLSEVPRLTRAVIIDVALHLDQALPPDGHLPPVPVMGLLRH
jgi:ADP-ribose pyrophosphatase YjhB (NUDIX family)